MANLENPIPQVQDRRPKIAGLLPKNAQTRVLTGIAILMILVMMFSGRTSPPAKSAPNAAPTPTTMDPNAARIQEYRARIEEQTRQLALEEAQLAQTKQSLGVGPATSSQAGLRPPSPASPMPASYAPAYAGAPEKNWIELDREKRDYQGLYASNIVLSYRTLPETAAGKSAPDREEISSFSGANNPTAKPAGEKPKTTQYRLFEGTIIETVLTNRLDSSFAGPVNCMVTTNVYARDHQTLLIPQGTRVLGEVRKLESFGEHRLAVVFHRIIMPDDSSVSLDQFKGLDQIGETGLIDQVNHHYFQIFGVSVAIGAIAGLSQATTRYSLDESGAQAYEQGVAGGLSQSSLHILDRYLNVLPTFTIREGHRIKIYFSQDLLLPVYGERPAADL
jgi:type IV secretion system protein VirB10